MPWGERLRSGVHDAAPLSRGPRQRHLGGLGQRHLPRRAARIEREPESVEALLAELKTARGADRRYERFVERLERQLAERGGLEARVRRLVEDAALALQASLLLRHAPPAIADAFCASRLDDAPGGAHGLAFGTLPAGLDFRAIIERAISTPCR